MDNDASGPDAPTGADAPGDATAERPTASHSDDNTQGGDLAAADGPDGAAARKRRRGSTTS